MTSQHAVDGWADGTRRGRQVFNYGYSPSGRGFQGWTLLKTVTMRDDGDAVEKAYIWQGANDPGREQIRIDVTERHAWRLAQESLSARLEECMRPDMPRGTKALAQVGDVVFVGRAAVTDVPAAVLFSRGNVCVSVASVGERTVDVSAVAFGVDRALGDSPSGKELELGEVRVQAPRVAAVRTNEAFVLIPSLQKAAPRGVWLKVVVPDGELARKGDAVVYVSPRGGKKEVGVFARSAR